MAAKQTSAREVTWAQVAAFRMARHHLTGGAAAGIAKICGDVCGIQAQVMSAARMALWARNHGVTRAAIDAALWEKRALVKTSAMRNTLHLLPAQDLLAFLSALKAGRLHLMHRVMKKYGGVTPAAAERVMLAAVDALRDGPLTRGELTERVLASGIVRGKAKKWFELGWWGVARQAIVEGLVCYGPDRGAETTYVRLEQWLPRLRRVPEDEARRIVLRRYLRAYGPATPQDFARWSGNSMSEVHKAWGMCQEELIEVDCEGRKAALLREDLGALHAARLGAPVVRLLPNFDVYLLGHDAKDHLVTPRFYDRVYRKAGWISSAVLVDGRVAGTWTQGEVKKRLRVTVEPFEKFSRPVRARIDKEAAALAEFLGVPGGWEVVV